MSITCHARLGWLSLGIAVAACSPEPAAEEEFPQDTHPVMSPDGRHVAYLSNREGVAAGLPINFEIYVRDLETGAEQRLTTNDDFEAGITWSPDGERIAFKSYRDGNDEIYVMDASGAGQTNLTRHPAADHDPSWSPDGEWILFNSARDGNNDLYMMRPDGSDVRRLTDHPAADYAAQWSPDGARIAFVSERDGNPEVYTMAAAGGDLQRVTRAELSDWSPVWSPDGSMLAVTYGDWETESWSIVVMRSDGSDRRVLFDGSDSGNATWARDGQSLMFGAPLEDGGRLITVGLDGQVLTTPY